MLWQPGVEAHPLNLYHKLLSIVGDWTAKLHVNESTKVHNARRVHKVVTESDVANVEIISWNCIIILHVNL